MTYGFIYIWYDQKHKRYYVGSHWGSEDDGYICSSNWMRDAHRRRPNDFKRRVIQRIYTNRQDLLEAENAWHRLIKPHELRTRYYNLHTNHSNHWLGNEEKRLSVSEKIRKTVIEHYSNMSREERSRRHGRVGNLNRLGKKLNEEQRKQLSDAHKGITHSEETKAKMRGRKWSAETRSKILATKQRRRQERLYGG